MKFTTKLLIFWISVLFIFSLGMIFVLSVFFGIRLNFFQLFIAFIINGIIPPIIITALFYRKLQYMESEDLEPPTFKGQKKAEFQFDPKSRFPFAELMQRIDRQWIISYSNRKKKIVKFRTDSRMFSWGICGYVKMEEDYTVHVVVYPIFDNSRREERILNQTLRVMHLIINP